MSFSLFTNKQIDEIKSPGSSIIFDSATSSSIIFDSGHLVAQSGVSVYAVLPAFRFTG